MLKIKLQEDLKESLKSGDKVKRLTLGTLMASIKSREIIKRGQLSKTITDSVELEQQSQLNDEEIIQVIAGEAKKRKESIEQFNAGGRAELAEKEQLELDVLTAYLPEQLGEDDVRKEVEAVIAEIGAKDIKDMGKVVGSVMSRLKGRADGSVVSKLVKELLAV